MDANSWRITTKELVASHLDPDLCRRIRASILIAGPVLARAGGLRLPPPGGDVIGRRRLDTHILALRALGAAVNYDRMFDITSTGLKGADILLDEASVTATENAVMAAVLAKGVTPVSYTHLDVYKRQIFWQWGMKRVWRNRPDNFYRHIISY